MKNILIIEDSPKHLEDAKNFFSTIDNIRVTYQESYEPFNSMTRCNTPFQSDNFSMYDGVISDIYFPDKPGRTIQPIGVSVMFQCKMMNIPCVLCTDGYHHGSHYQWINDMVNGLATDGGWKTIPPIIDSLDGSEKLKEEGENGEKVATKGWAKAWEKLQKQF